MEILRDIRAASSTLPCFALMGLLWAGFHAYAPQLKAQAGASDWGFALALLGSAICSLGAMLLAPRVERLAGARGLLSAGLLLIICFQSVQRIGSYEALCLALALIGAAMGLMDVLMNAHVARLEARSRRTLMALNHGVYSLIYALGALVAAGLRGAEISIVVYAQGAALCGVLLLWSARWIDLGSSLGVQAPLGNPAGAPERLRGAGMRAALWAGAIVAVGFACENAVEAWSALHLERSLQGNPAQGPLGPAALGLTMALGRFSGQFLLRRMAAAALLGHGARLAALGCGIAALASSREWPISASPPAGLGISVLAPVALSLLGQSVAPEQRSQAIARAAVLGYCGFFFGPPLVGAMAELAGLRAVFALVAAALMTIPLLLRSRFFWLTIPRG